jgi:hypothetical protein
MKFEHIPTSEIEKDILDTEKEIATMAREIEGLTLLGDRWSLMKADARRTGINERTEFVQKLRVVLLERTH